MPAAHSTHAVAPALAWYFPTEQLEQAELPAEVEYRPVGHRSHAVAPANEKVPARQVVQDADPADLYWPAEHSPHTAVWTEVWTEQEDAEHARAPQHEYCCEEQPVQAPLRSAGKLSVHMASAELEQETASFPVPELNVPGSLQALSTDRVGSLSA